MSGRLRRVILRFEMGGKTYLVACYKWEEVRDWVNR